VTLKGFQVDSAARTTRDAGFAAIACGALSTVTGVADLIAPMQLAKTISPSCALRSCSGVIECVAVSTSAGCAWASRITVCSCCRTSWPVRLGFTLERVVGVGARLYGSLHASCACRQTWLRTLRTQHRFCSCGRDDDLCLGFQTDRSLS